MTTQPEPAPEPLKDATTEAKAGAIRAALAAGIGASHRGVGYIRDHLAAKVLPRRLASLVSLGCDCPEQGSAEAKRADALTAIEIEDLNAIKALVEKYGADRVKQLAELLGERDG